MARGRKPIPTALKKARGNPGGRPLNDREPEPTPGVPPKPDDLSPAAAAEWDFIVPELIRMGVLTVVDRSVLVAYCRCAGVIAQSESTLAAEGSVLQTEKGYAYPHPAMAQMMTAQKQQIGYAAELGLTPASRTKVKRIAPTSQDDKAKLLTIVG